MLIVGRCAVFEQQFRLQRQTHIVTAVTRKMQPIVRVHRCNYFIVVQNVTDSGGQKADCVGFGKHPADFFAFRRGIIQILRWIYQQKQLVGLRRCRVALETAFERIQARRVSDVVLVIR